MEDVFEALQGTDESEDVGKKYRHLFSSSLGREVLADILGECHFGSTLDPDNKAQVAEYNVGVLILAKCGVFIHGTKMDVINGLLNSVPIKGR